MSEASGSAQPEMELATGANPNGEEPEKISPRTISRRSAGGMKSAAISRAACDACRLRKTKCEPVEDPEAQSPNGSLEPRTRKRPREVETCKACARASLDCTFDMPVRRRGPPSRLRLARAQVSAKAQSQSTPEQLPASIKLLAEASEYASPHSMVAMPGYGRGITTLDVAATGLSDSIAYDSPNPPSYTTPEPRLTATLGTLASPVRFLTASFPAGLALTTDLICSKALFDTIMEDYINMLHPLIPMVHIPTFRADLERQRQTFDPVFYALTVALCSATIAIMLRKFQEYQRSDPSFRFKTRREVIDYCNRLISAAKPDDYHDHPSFEKWAVAYAQALGYAHLRRGENFRVKSREGTEILWQLKVHIRSSYRGLDYVETQLRKKAFWLEFYTHIHHRMWGYNYMAFSDRVYFEEADAEDLMPLEVDDEYITRTNVYGQPPDKPSVVVAFNCLSRIFWCLLPVFRDPTMPIVTTSESRQHFPDEIGRCSCGNAILPASRKGVIQAILNKLRYILDDVPQEFSAWHNDLQEGHKAYDEITQVQYESTRANIHVTHLLAQSFLTEKLVTLGSSDSDSQKGGEDAKFVWSLREDICRQLLQILYNIRQSNLEPNGMTVAWKVREVASTLLNCPFEEQSQIARRANSYISKFVDLLTRVDANTEPREPWVELANWINLDQQPRTTPSDFLA